MMPSMPNLPGPSEGGMNGTQFLAASSVKWLSTISPPTTMNAVSTLTLIATMTLLTFADSDTPTTSRTASTMQIRKAGRLKIVVTVWPSMSTGTPSFISV